MNEENAPELTLEPSLDQKALDDVGIHLQTLFDRYKKDRSEVEKIWAKNYRQYKGKYDPEIIIPKGQSQVYPKLTRVKVVGMVSRLMDMLFPQTEKNWGLAVSPVPDIGQAELQQILDDLQAQAQGADLPSEVIEKAVVTFAKERMKQLEKEIDDQLTELEYVQLVRKVVRSAVIYNTGVLRGPMNRKVKSRRWQRDFNGRYVAVETTKLRPVFEFVPLVDYYPDLTAKTWDTMDGEFQRHIMDHHSALALAARPDFMSERVKAYLRDNPDGNWREEPFETEMRMDSTDRVNARVLEGRKYEVIQYWGRLTGKDLKAMGVTIAENELEKDIEANIWFIDNTVIKAAINPFKGKVKMFHQFVFEEDDASLTGQGLPEIYRDTQMAVCSAARMLLDNASVTTGPILEMNTDLLTPGQDLNPHARKTYFREGVGSEASQPAIREIRVDAHMQELVGIITLFKGFGDEETLLPPQAMGMISQAGPGKEAYRTAQGTSMLMGAAALPIRDTVRNFDAFTMSVIGSLIEWNMMFGNSEARGDFQPIARGSTSLIAKEVRAQALDQLSFTLQPDERKLVKIKDLLRERLIVRDLPIDIIKDDDMIEQENQLEAQMAERMQQFNDAMQGAQLREVDSKTARNEAQASKTDIEARIRALEAIIGGAYGE